MKNPCTSCESGKLILNGSVITCPFCSGTGENVVAESTQEADLLKAGNWIADSIVGYPECLADDSSQVSSREFYNEK